MRRFGILMVIAGLGLGVLWPWAQSNFFQDEIARIEMTGLRETGSTQTVIELGKSDSPLQIRFVAKYKIAGKLPPLKIPLYAKFSDRDGTLLATIISFPTKGIGSEPELPKQRSSNAIELALENDGLHALSLSYAPNKNDNGIERPDIESITAVFVRNASPIDDTYLITGGMIAVLGMYLVVRRRKSKGSGNPRWGRGA